MLRAALGAREERLGSLEWMPQRLRRRSGARLKAVDLACCFTLQATGWHEGGFVGFRRGYLQQLPQDRFAPLGLNEQTDGDPVVAVCETFWLHELLFETFDTLLCAVLVLYTVYIGYSHTQRVINGEGMLSRGHGPAKGGKPGVRV